MSTATLERTELGVGEIPTPPDPVHFGPTWDVHPDWRPDDPTSPYKFILPERTLGWQVQAWVEGVPELGIPANILSDETDEFGDPLPFRFTQEQLRFILWLYAVDERGRFLYRDIVLQRLKGWGKDPIAAVIAAVEFVGPCRFGGWASVDMPHLGLRAGDPIGRRHPRAWVQLAAVAKSQTRNTMTLFPGLFSQACVDEHRIDIGKEVIYAHHGRVRIEVVTSNPRTLEGGRPTFVIKNETHHWIETNQGHEMADVIERNAVKAKDAAARTLSITNAYDPSEGSVAQQERESWELEVASGWSVTTMYDSLEAHPDALIALPPVLVGVDESGDKRFREPSEEEYRAYIGAIISAVRGDSTWLDVENIVSAILKPRSDVNKSRRFYYNQVKAAEDAWVPNKAIQATVDPFVAAERKRPGADPLRVGWIPVGQEEPIALFFDGSKAYDSTGLVGVRISDGYTFMLGVWQAPKGADLDGRWLAPREEVDERVKEVHKRFTVVAFFGDPSHALDDDDDTRYWDSYLDDWHRDYRSQYAVWAVRTGDNQHSVMWDMTGPSRQEQFVKAAERVRGELIRKNDVEEFEPAFQTCGHPALLTHLRNARAYRHPKGYGISIHKGSRNSKRKIDLAVCVVGARMLRRLVLNREEEQQEKPKASVVW